jgi:hypothetical protein
MNFNFVLTGDILNYIKYDKTKMYFIEIAGKAFFRQLYIYFMSHNLCWNKNKNKKLVGSIFVLLCKLITVYYSTIAPMVYVIEKARTFYALFLRVHVYSLRHKRKRNSNLFCALCCYICNLNIQNLTMKYVVLFINRKHKY